MSMSIDSTDKIKAEVISCKLCNLCRNRTNAVPGEGNSKASIMFVGEAPGRNEDEKGRPFVGLAGKILDETLDKVGIVRSRIFVTNIVKCRPPGNRVPTEEEQRVCKNYLEREIYEQYKHHRFRQEASRKNQYRNRSKSKNNRI